MRDEHEIVADIRHAEDWGFLDEIPALEAELEAVRDAHRQKGDLVGAANDQAVAEWLADRARRAQSCPSREEPEHEHAS